MVKVVLKFIVLLGFSLSSLSCAETSDFAHSRYSGKYEQISVAVSSEGRVVGFFKEDMGENLSCYFGFSGNLVGGRAQIVVNNEEGYEGSLVFNQDSLVLAIPEAQQIPGCGMILIPEIANGLKYGPKIGANWVDVKVVDQNGVSLRDSASHNSELLGVLNKWQVLGVLEEEGDWLRVSFYRVELIGDRVVRGFKEGWVESSGIKGVE